MRGRHNIPPLTYGKRDGNDDVSCRPVFCRCILNASGINALQSPQLNSYRVFLADDPSAIRGKRRLSGQESQKYDHQQLYRASAFHLDTASNIQISRIQWSTRLSNRYVLYSDTVLRPFKMPINPEPPMLLRATHKRSLFSGPTYRRKFVRSL